MNEQPTSNCTSSRHTAHWLNKNCACSTLERQLLPKLEASDFLFSHTPVYLTEQQLRQIEDQISTLETTITGDDFAKAVLPDAPAIAEIETGAFGMFMGYDFHMSSDGPKLIEINTNAGGAFIVDALYRAQDICCWNGKPLENKAFAQTIADMFVNEWRAAGASHPLKTIAIVDEDPKNQFLMGEFLLVQEMLEGYGFTVVIADPAELIFADGKLKFQELDVDLVYNRSTDFYFDKASHKALKAAYEAQAAVISPNPRHHALFAAKQNLARLSDSAFLRAMDAPQSNIEQLSVLPKSQRITNENADAIWQNRKKLFFKPLAGHGGKAVYRGDKVTKRVWAHILEHDYIAQELAPADLRHAKCDAETDPQDLKSDIRVYTYRGKPIISAARLYKGQTTNFRTIGGGFAPIYVV